jgi:hypothetical protein
MASEAPPSELQGYCINLDRRTDKWKQTQEDLKGTGLNVSRFSAIPHAEGWKGCGFSHVALARLAKQKELDWILVLEDDCMPTPWFAQRWPKIKQTLWEERASWDIFLGGPTYLSGPIDPVRPELVKIAQGLTTHFYVLNATAYDKVIAWNPERDGPIDWYFSKNLRIITTTPFLAVQRPSISDIKGTEFNYEGLFQSSQETLEKLKYGHERRGSVIAFLLLGGLLVWMLRS